MCWESRDINPVDSYMVELSKLTDEENGDIITEWVTIPSSPWPVEMKSFQVTWHQIALRKDSGPFDEFTFINIPVSKINCINVNRKLLYRVWEKGRSKCKNLHSLSQTLSYPHYWQLCKVKCCWWATREADHVISCVIQKNNLKGLPLFSTLSFSLNLFSVDLLLGFLTVKS